MNAFPLLSSLFDPRTCMRDSEQLLSLFFFFSFYYSEIVPLSCFTEVEVSDYYKRRWKALYYEYLGESTNFCKLENKEEKNNNFRRLYQEYKRVSKDSTPPVE